MYRLHVDLPTSPSKMRFALCDRNGAYIASCPSFEAALLRGQEDGHFQFQVIGVGGKPLAWVETDLPECD